MVPDGKSGISAHALREIRGARWKIGLRLGLICAGLAMGFLTNELAFRLFLPFLPGQVKDQISVIAPALRSQSLAWSQLHDPDPYLGYILRPSIRLYVQLRNDLPPTTITTNELGFRGPSPKGAPVIVVGDSMAFGYGVDDEKTSASELSRSLGVRVATLGVSGYSPSHYNRALDKYGLPNRPQVVLYYLTLGNDFAGLQVLDDETVQSTTTTPNIASRVKGYLSAYSIMYQLTKWLISTGMYQYGRHVQFRSLDLYFYFDNSSYNLQYQNIRRNFAIVDDNLKRAWTRSRLAGVELVFVIIPTKESVYRHVAERYAPSPSFFEAEDDLRERIISLCQARGWRCLDLTPTFQRLAVRGEQLYFVYDGHWNEAGNKLAAAEISRYMIQEKLLH